MPTKKIWIATRRIARQNWDDGVWLPGDELPDDVVRTLIKLDSKALRQKTVNIPATKPKVKKDDE